MGADDGGRLRERLAVLRAQAGDRRAFHELVDLYQHRLMYYVRRMVRAPHECQDVLQDIWLQVFRSLRRLQSLEAFRVWLYRIAHRRAATHVRQRGEDVQAIENLANEAECVDSWNELDVLEDAEAVHWALGRLSDMHRETLTLRFLEDLTVSEIAEILGCSEGTAKSRLHYAKLAVRRLLEDRRHA